MSKQYVKCLIGGLRAMTKHGTYEVIHRSPEDESVVYVINDFGHEDYYMLGRGFFELCDPPKQSSRKCRPLTDEEKQFILDRPDQSSRSLAKQLWGKSGRKSTINDFRKSVKAEGETEFLLKSEKNRQRLMESVDEVVNTKPREQKTVEKRYVLNDKGECVDRVTGEVTVDGEDINQRILLISDLHIPYHHKDALEFLQHLKDKYCPTRVICMGDELDKHALSFHDSDPDLPSAGDELRQSLPIIKDLHEMFPVMDILDSNHGSLVYRKSKHHGIPRHYIKSYREVLEVDDGWTWHYDMTLKLPTGNHFYLCHGKTADVTKLTQQMGMCAAQGHFHEKYKIEYWSTPVALTWGLQTGCLIDDSSYAFSYNNSNLKRPLIGTAVVIDGYPILEPMVMDEDGRWVGRKK